VSKCQNENITSELLYIDDIQTGKRIIKSIEGKKDVFPLLYVKLHRSFQLNNYTVNEKNPILQFF